MLATLPNLDEILAEKARRHLCDFARQAWPLVEPGTPLRWNWHLDAIFEHLEAVTLGQIQNLLINIPPGHLKSLGVSVFWPAWVWIRRPEWRALYSSYAEDLSIRDSVKSRLIISSDWYQRSFVKGTWQLAGDQNVKSYYQNTRMGFRIGTGVSGKGTGLRADAVVVDDPLKATDAWSEAKRKEVLRWWDQEMANRVSDPRKGVRVIIMQRLHDLDLSGHVLAEGGWEHLRLPSEFEPKQRTVTCIGWTDPRKEEGELLFPEMYTREVLAKEKKRLGSIGFPGQHQQRPTAAEGGVFKRAWFKRWHKPGDFVPVGVESRLLPDRWDQELISVDCSFKDTETADFVAMGVWGRVGPDKFLRDQVRDRLSFTETLKKLLELIAAYPRARAKLIEDKANGPAIISVLKKKIPGIIAVNPEGGKEARAHAVSPEVEAGNVYIPFNAPWVHAYIEEMCSFPKAANDDQVDQTTQALLRFAKARGGIEALEALAGG